MLVTTVGAGSASAFFSFFLTGVFFFVVVVFFFFFLTCEGPASSCVGFFLHVATKLHLVDMS
jgi:hypothetical protein